MKPLPKSAKHPQSSMRSSVRAVWVEVGPAAVPFLVAALAHGRHARAFKALVRLREPAVVPLVKALAESTPPVTQRISHTLVRIGAPSVPALCCALEHCEADTAQTVIRTLARIGAPAMIPVAQLLFGSPVVAERAAEVLAQIGTAALPALHRALENPTHTAGAAAAKALGKIRTSESVPLLTRAVHDPSGEVSVQAIRALVRIGDPGTVPTLMEALAHPDLRVQAEAAVALQQFPTEHTLPRLCQLAGSDDLLIARHAIACLGRMADTQAVPILVAALAKPELRYSAAWALAFIAERDPDICLQSAVVSLRRLSVWLSSVDWESRNACLAALHQIERVTRSRERLPLPARDQPHASDAYPVPSVPGQPKPDMYPLPATQHQHERRQSTLPPLMHRFSRYARALLKCKG